jgi:hypothetical protein
MLRTTARLLPGLVAACLLGGCTIEINTGGGAKKPAQPQSGPGGPAPTARPGQAAPVRRQHPRVPPTATRIKSPIVFGNGKAGAFQGLAYVLPDSTKSIPPTAGLVPFAALYTDRFDIQPQEFSSGFPGALMQNEWFLIRYEGEFRVPGAGQWQFRVISDDGARLYVDDKIVVDNDGVHTAKTTDGQATLTPGPHWLTLDYFQAAKGQIALTVLMGQGGKLSPLVGTR